MNRNEFMLKSSESRTYNYNVQNAIFSNIAGPYSIILINTPLLSSHISCSTFESLRLSSSYGSSAIDCNIKVFEFNKCFLFDCVGSHNPTISIGGCAICATFSNALMSLVSLRKCALAEYSSHYSIVLYFLDDSSCIDSLNITEASNINADSWCSRIGLVFAQHSFDRISDIFLSNCTSSSIIIMSLQSGTIERLAIIDCPEQSACAQIWVYILPQNSLKGGIFVNSGTVVARIQSCTGVIFNDWVLDVPLNGLSISSFFSNASYSSHPQLPLSFDSITEKCELPNRNNYDNTGVSRKALLLIFSFNILNSEVLYRSIKNRQTN